jgi:pSer/pThr/pTyr-binding forkhead associated (FHA) protein
LISTGGTFVNGVKIDKQILDKGDVITLSGIHLVFGQDEFPQAESTSRYIFPDTKPQADLHTRNLSPDTVRLKKPDEGQAD